MIDTEEYRDMAERMFRRYYRPERPPEYDGTWILLNEPFRHNLLGINDALLDKEKNFPMKVLSGDIEGVRHAIHDAVAEIETKTKRCVKTIKEESNSVIERCEEFHEVLVEDMSVVNKILSGIPNVERDGFTLIVKGKLAIYEISLLLGQVEAFCFQHHQKPRTLCIRADAQFQEINGPKIHHGGIRKALQIALNLVNDHELKDRTLYGSLFGLVMCPLCYLEGKTSHEAVQTLSQRIWRPELYADLCSGR